MNRFVASAGVLVAGVAGLQAANVEGLTPQQASKWWTVSASLRGFYDDNVYQTGSKDGSPGVEFEPAVSINLPRDRTLLTAKYAYRLNYYSDRGDESVDQHHQFNLRVNHKFSERYSVNVEDSFVYSNEPEVIAGGGVQTTYGRANATALRNYVPIDFNARLTRLIGVAIGYQNSFYDYQEDNTDIGGIGSYSALLDRSENVFHVEGEWYFSETTIAFLGYQYGTVDYTDGIIANDGVNDLPGTVRNARSHYGYVGAAHTFTKELSGIARVGVQAIDYYNLNENELSPYVDLTGSYAYLPGNVFKLGVKVAHAPTDLVGSGGDVTRDQLATTFYGNLVHRLTPRITGNLLAQYTHSVFNGGDYDGETESFVNLGLSFGYQINKNLIATLAYSFDILTSDIPVRDFDRNRVWAGITATY